MKDNQMSIVEHFEELRMRIIISAIGLVVLTIFSYYYIKDILKIFTKPVDGVIVYIVPAEVFLTQIKLAFFAGLLLTLPVIIYQILRFVLPGLKKNEKKYLIILLPLSYIFFLLGISFAFFVVIPFAIKFFMSFSSTDLRAMLSLGNYISFVIKVLIPFGVIFDLPLLITLLVKLNLISADLLQRKRRYVIVLVFVISAVLTPPDIISQAMMSLPLILLYELSIFIAKIISKKKI